MITCPIYRKLHKNCSLQRVDTSDFEILISDDIQEFSKEWNSLEIKDIFFQLPYLSIVQKYGSTNVDSFFVIVKKQEEIQAALLYQISDFDLNSRMKDEGENNSRIKKIIQKKMKHKVLVHGNLYLSGHHMNYFKNKNSTPKQKNEWLIQITNEVKNNLQKQNKSIDAILIKDKDEHIKQSQLLESTENFTSFCVDPNMVLEIPKNWTDSSHYLLELKSKYRVRYKKARSSKEGLIFKRMNTNDLQENSEAIYELYKNTATEADFNIGLLKEGYFINLKKQLGRNCDVFAYYDNDKLIAFYTCIKNGKKYYAHYLGFDSSYNKSHKLYLNILYDIVEEGIIGGFEKIYFSRTALEIKSTVGAIAHELYCYIKLETKIHNKFLPFLLKKIIPELNWIQRSPFKINNNVHN